MLRSATIASAPSDCKECNDDLAVNDKILAVLSVLSVFAGRELGGVGPELWDIDHERGGLLCDARSIKGSDAPVRKPQIIFDGDPPLICFDEDDAKIDPQELQDRFYPRLKSAYDFFVQFGAEARKADHKGRDMLKLKQVARRQSATWRCGYWCCARNNYGSKFARNRRKIHQPAGREISFTNLRGGTSYVAQQRRKIQRVRDSRRD